MPDLIHLQTSLGYRFNNIELLKQASSHRSFANNCHNERMEFLGDSIVNMLAATFLYQRFADADEGQLTRLRALLVCRESLAEAACKLQLHNYLQVGTSFHQGQTLSDRLLCNTYEALIGALYEDGGLGACEPPLLDHFSQRIEGLTPISNIDNAKSKLQEWLQHRNLPLPEYEVTNVQGPSHNCRYEIRCQLANVSHFPEEGTVGIGSSRRSAEQEAAQLAMSHLQATFPQGGQSSPPFHE